MSLIKILSDLHSGYSITIAGVGFSEQIPAKEADVGWPMGVVRRPDGDLVVVDYHAHCLWRIDQDGILHRFAGDGIPGNRGDGELAKNARFYFPHDLTQDKYGNLYISDLGNQTIRCINYQTGIITHIAGSGAVGRGGDGGLAIDAELDTTCGIAVDDKGNIYLSSEWANSIRRIDAETGIITHFAGQFAQHHDSNSKLPKSGPAISLMGYHGDGGLAKDAAFHHPEHLAMDSNGDLYICDNSNDRIRKIDMQTGIITTVFGNGQRSSNGDGGLAIDASTLMPDAICLDAHDNLYVGEKYGYRVRKVDAKTGIVTTLVGNGVPAFGEEGLLGEQTHCNSVEAGIWADPDGTVLWSDCSGRLRRYDGDTNIVTTVLGGTSVHDNEVAIEGFLCGPGGLATSADGKIYIADVWNQRIRMIDPKSNTIHTIAGDGSRAYGGDNGKATDAYLGNPHDVSVDSTGRVVLADTRNGRIRRVEHDGIIRVIAGTTLPWDAGEGRWDKGDGGSALSASLAHVESVVHAPNDDIYLGDCIGRIRKIDHQGIITSIAGNGFTGYTGDGGVATQAQIGCPSALCFDSQGNLYFADRMFHVIRKIDIHGIITTIVGSGIAGFSDDGTFAQNAQINMPYGIAISKDDQLYFSDSKNNRVRRLNKHNQLETVVGTGLAGDAGYNVIATQAQLNEPHGLCFYKDNILLISDHYNNQVRVLKI